MLLTLRRFRGRFVCPFLYITFDNIYQVLIFANIVKGVTESLSSPPPPPNDKKAFLRALTHLLQSTTSGAESSLLTDLDMLGRATGISARDLKPLLFRAEPSIRVVKGKTKPKTHHKSRGGGGGGISLRAILQSE